MESKQEGVSEIYNDGSYLTNNETWHVEDSPWKASQISKIIMKNDIQIDNICEVGCGAGEILRQLSLFDHLSNVKFTGYEVSKDAYSLCMKRASDIISFEFTDILSEDVMYDVALCIDVFEHVEDYIGFLKKLRFKAKYKIFHIPLDLSVSSILRNALVDVRSSVGHLHYFTPSTALETLKDCGYEIIDTMYTPTFADIPAKKIKTKIAKLPRHILYKVSPKLMSTLLGGCSLMVIAK
jgi:hypothetical protein